MGNRQGNKPKEVWVDEKLYDIPLQIEEELCRQMNIGILRDVEKIKIIMEFISDAK